MKRFLCRYQTNNAASPIYCGTGALDRPISPKFIGQFSAVFAVVDKRVYGLHSEGILNDLLERTPVYHFPRGEKHKTLPRAQRILEWLWENKADRKCLLLGIGGGVVTDITGFVASCYKRGVSYVSIPTTLLAQVDAAIGGKTAVNLRGTKNIVGSLFAPAMVVCDSRFLASLRTAHIKEGLVEAIKIFALRDRRLFDEHAANLNGLLKRQGLESLIANAVSAKLEVVNADPYETGLRRVLNFGHTTGHALELVAGWSHGRSIALGMMVALILSRHLVSLSQADCDAVWHALSAIYDSRDRDVPDVDPLWTSIQHDKKRTGTQINFILMPRCGSYRIEPVTYKQFKRALMETSERIHK